MTYRDHVAIALRSGQPAVLARASHPGPTVAVTILTGLLAGVFGVGLGRGTVVTLAVLAGQLTIGWSNDLVDAERDRRSGRTDKPVAEGDLAEGLLRTAIGVAVVACVGLSLACGWRSATVHLLLGVASGWAYNLGLKRTLWSAVPYAVAFGALPAIVSLAAADPVWPPRWMMLTGALLGVGAHLLNALPDLADDVATGVLGLPQRLGARRVRWLAPAILLAGSAVATFGPAEPAGAWVLCTLGLCVVLAGAAVVGRGKVPFAAAVGIAFVDVVVLVLR